MVDDDGAVRHSKLLLLLLAKARVASLDLREETRGRLDWIGGFVVAKASALCIASIFHANARVKGSFGRNCRRDLGLRWEVDAVMIMIYYLRQERRRDVCWLFCALLR